MVSLRFMCVTVAGWVADVGVDSETVRGSAEAGGGLA